MNDLRIVIDAGHGGTDPGAVSQGVYEKDLTLMISREMYEQFQQRGIPVTLIRSVDETLTPNERVRRILEAYGNSPNVVVISNHINSSSSDTSRGAEVIYALRNTDTLAQNILDGLEQEGLYPRRVFQRTLPSNPSKDYYFIHRDTGVTQPVIIEYGFINNPEELRMIQENYPRYVTAVVNAVIETFEPEKTEEVLYTVKKGDTLWKIAQLLDTTVDAIKEANQLDSDIIREGQVLRVPSNVKVVGTYVVQRGDTLWRIAQMYHTTVDAIKTLNGLTSDLLLVGQQLLIPGNLTMYTVQKGDTLWSIANRFQTTVAGIREANRLTNDMIYVGQVLQIP